MEFLTLNFSCFEFLYFFIIVGEEADYESDSDGDNDSVEGICCDGCCIWYHLPCALKPWPQKSQTNVVKSGFAACKSELLDYL